MAGGISPRIIPHICSGDEFEALARKETEKICFVKLRKALKFKEAITALTLTSTNCK